MSSSFNKVKLDQNTTLPEEQLQRWRYGSPLGGRQEKYYDAKTMEYHKYDSPGSHEALVEILVDSFLDHATFNDHRLIHASYFIRHSSDNRVTAVSPSFLRPGEREVSLYTLLDSYEELEHLSTLPTAYAQCECLCEIVRKYTLLDSFREWFAYTILADLFVYNVDRTFHNISFCNRSGNYRIAPMFDFGRALVGINTGDYQQSCEAYDPNPFLNEQIDWALCTTGHVLVRVQKEFLDTERVRSLSSFYDAVTVQAYKNRFKTSLCNIERALTGAVSVEVV